MSSMSVLRKTCWRLSKARPASSDLMRSGRSCAQKKTYDTDVSMWLHHSAMNLLELQRENETLKLRLFWEKYGPDKLKAVMRLVNEQDWMGCICLACIQSDRHERGCRRIDASNDGPCKFKPQFEYELREHDMSFACGLPHVPIWVDGSVVNSRNNVLDDGHHFTNLGSHDWVSWTYGSKLWKATSVDDPELAKLKSLFETLENYGY